MNALTLRLNTWSEARLLADELNGWIFRGQQDASWLLSTSLQRAGQQGQHTSALLSKLEEQAIEEFQRRAHHFLPVPPPVENVIEWMALIQHFGGPTRLLDFTSSFYVAAFFAVERASADCAIWCVNDYALYKAVGPLLGLDMEKASLPYWQVPHRMAAVAQKMLRQHQGGCKPFVFSVQPFRLNERLAVQQGLFLCPLSVDIPFMQSLSATFGSQPGAFADTGAEDYKPPIHTRKMLGEVAVIKILIPLAVHYDALQDLWGMNVNAATLFPGLDGFARSLHHYLRMDNLWHIKYSRGSFV
jgi:FRG domain